MKKIVLVIFALIIFLSLGSIEAATITKTSYTNGRITIEGTGSGEIQIVLFGLDNQPLYMTTTTSENNLYSITLPEINGLTPGTYTVKVSDYDGTNVATSTVRIIAETNPQTSDNILLYIITGLICIVGIAIIGIYFYKNKKIKQG
ncbi:MAG TPA: hypothetical protein PKY25_02045 [Bacilli bacterium]|nr:hypothetical protein [Bacilli bacterium]